MRQAILSIDETWVGSRPNSVGDRACIQFCGVQRAVRDVEIRFGGITRTADASPLRCSIMDALSIVVEP